MDRFLSVAAKFVAYLGFLPRSEIRHMYAWKASAVAYARVNGTPPLTEQMVNEWCLWEVRYANAGYRPFSLNIIELAVRKQESLHDPEWHQKLLKGEHAILHASRFRQNFLEGASP